MHKFILNDEYKFNAASEKNEKNIAKFTSAHTHTHTLRVWYTKYQDEANEAFSSLLLLLRNFYVFALKTIELHRIGIIQRQIGIRNDQGSENCCHRRDKIFMEFNN